LDGSSGLLAASRGVSLSLFIPIVPSWVWVLLVAAYNLVVNWFGVKTSARFNFGTLILQFILLILVLLAAMLAMHKLSLPTFTSDAWWTSTESIGGVFSGASLCVMAYLGFDAITTLSAEVRQDQRHLVGRAVIFSIGLLGVLAVLNAWILSDLARGYTFAADLTTAAFDLLGARVDPAFGRIVTWASVLAVAISITPPMVTAVARVLYTMAEKGEMPHFLSKLHPKYGVPRNAILTSGALSIVVALYFANQFDTLTSMVNFGALTAFAAVNASVIALFILKRKSRRLVVHLLLPLLGIGTIIALGWLPAASLPACCDRGPDSAPSRLERVIRTPGFSTHLSKVISIQMENYMQLVTIKKTAAWLICCAATCAASQAVVAAETAADGSRAQIAATLKSMEKALARGENATTISKMLYASNVLITGEAEAGGTRGMDGAIKDVQGWMDSLGPNGAKGCGYTIVDPVVSSATTFSSFILLKCKANPPVLPQDQELRMMYIWKKQSQGWRVVLEMWAPGKL
jgi:amino acid transporter